MKYYAKNRYFQNEINNYFKKHKWTFDKNNQYFQDIDYFNKNKCKSCKIISQIKNIDYLGNKKIQYESLEMQTLVLFDIVQILKIKILQINFGFNFFF